MSEAQRLFRELVSALKGLRNASATPDPLERRRAAQRLREAARDLATYVEEKE